jgi:single-stranded DNA-binding protein|tara:strand:- start:10596 stop:10913 length:318 start_codon:yes stop_codon:yes gene_type:complete
MNRCHFLGKLTEDPHLTTPYSTDLVNFTLEVEEYRRDKDGVKKRRTDLLNFEAWDSAAKTLHKYASKNDFLVVEAIARNTQSKKFAEVIFRVTNFKIFPQENKRL